MHMPHVHHNISYTTMRTYMLAASVSYTVDASWTHMSGSHTHTRIAFISTDDMHRSHADFTPHTIHCSEELS